MPPAERLLEAADTLFYDKGYGATGVNELIQEAGVAKASFYQHFETKDDLIVAFLRNRHDNWFAGLSAVVDKHIKPLRQVVEHRQQPDFNLFDAGHFALETHGGEIAAKIREFMMKNFVN